MRKDHGEKDAERLILERTADLGLPTGVAELARLRKGDKRKAMLAALLRRRPDGGLRMDCHTDANGTSWLGDPSGLRREA